MKKLFNGQLLEMTAAEIEALQAQQAQMPPEPEPSLAERLADLQTEMERLQAAIEQELSDAKTALELLGVTVDG